MPKIVSIDLETTGLDPDVHEPWEIAAVPQDREATRFHFHIQPEHLEHAEPAALRVGGFYERMVWPKANFAVTDLTVESDDHDDGYARAFAVEELLALATALDGATLLGLNVGSFDQIFLHNVMHKFGVAPAWEHRYLELGSYCAGAWGAKSPLSGKAIAERAEAHGIVNNDTHNALADAQWNMDVYNWVTGAEV